MSLRNDNLEVVLVGWVDAQRRDDVETIERHLHPDVVWQGLRPGPRLRQPRPGPPERPQPQPAAGPDVAGIELYAEGRPGLLFPRAEPPTSSTWLASSCTARVYDVFTIADGLIVRMDAYRSRETRR